MKVLYVAGWGRSGSTLLGRVLGQIEGFFLVGELRYLWDRGLIENRYCSCGEPFDRCPLWQQVVALTLPDHRTSAHSLVDLRERGLRTRHMVLTPARRSLQARVAGMGEYPATVERLYSAVREVSRGKVIVDTSKFPSYGYVLRNMPSVELYVLHLVRDPRAAAYSWESRRKLKPDHGARSDKFMTSHNFAKSSLAWNEWNLAIENLRRQVPERYMLLRYEDFVQNPHGSVERILELLGEMGAETPFTAERQVRLDIPHTFSGNPDRFSGGTITIKPEASWKRNMGTIRQAAVAALTWPGLIRYGYPLRPQRGNG